MQILALLLSGLMALLLLRLMLLPIRLGFRLMLHAGAGFLCLWLLNSASALTGVVIPINAVTVLSAGILGCPGIAVLAALAAIPPL